MLKQIALKIQKSNVSVSFLKRGMLD